MNETLKEVVNTLNQITVSGEKNMNMLLGCIITLKHLMETGGENNG